MEVVDGDGSCLFRSFSALYPQLNHRQWRLQLVDRIESRVLEEGSEKKWLGRGNVSLEGLVDEPYKTWEDLMSAMKGNQWGYSSFLLEFTLKQQVALVSFDPRGHASYIRDPALHKVKGTAFIFNQETPAGEQNCVLCVLLLCTLCVLCTQSCVLCTLCVVYTGVKVHFNPLFEVGPRVPKLQQMLDDWEKTFLSNRLPRDQADVHEIDSPPKRYMHFIMLWLHVVHIQSRLNSFSNISQSKLKSYFVCGLQFQKEEKKSVSAARISKRKPIHHIN